MMQFQNSGQTFSPRKDHFHQDRNKSATPHHYFTLNILNSLITFISPISASDRDYHPGGKLQSRLSSQVSVTFSHHHTLLLNVATLNTEDWVLRKLQASSVGYWPSRVQMSALRPPDWWTIDMLSQNVHNVLPAQSDVQMSRTYVVITMQYNHFSWSYLLNDS